MMRSRYLPPCWDTLCSGRMSTVTGKHSLSEGSFLPMRRTVPGGVDPLTASLESEKAYVQPGIAMCE